MLARLCLIGSILCSVINIAIADPASASGNGLIHVATCRDGKEAWAKTNQHRGVCRGHGGVVSWADGTPVTSPARKTEYK